MHKFADVDTFLRSTSSMLTLTIHAARTADRTTALRAADGAAQRRELADAARTTLRSQPWVPAPQVARRIRVIDDIAEIVGVLDAIAHLVAAPIDGPASLPSSRLDSDLRRVLDAGGRRLRQIQDGCVYMASEAGCTAALLDVVDHHRHAEDQLAHLTSQLAEAILTTSRHAAVAA